MRRFYLGLRYFLSNGNTSSFYWFPKQGDMIYTNVSNEPMLVIESHPFYDRIVVQNHVLSIKSVSPVRKNH